jgi:hypothetical protein
MKLGCDPPFPNCKKKIVCISQHFGPAHEQMSSQTPTNLSSPVRLLGVLPSCDRALEPLASRHLQSPWRIGDLGSRSVGTPPQSALTNRASRSRFDCLIVDPLLLFNPLPPSAFSERSRPTSPTCCCCSARTPTGGQ